MGMIASVRTCLGKYVTFSGRARRPEYWWFALAVILAQTAASGLDQALFGPVTEGGGTPIAMVLGLAIVLPYLAVSWRRMHDVGKPGWHSLLHYVFGVPVTVVTLAFAYSYDMTTTTPVPVETAPTQLWGAFVAAVPATAFLIPLFYVIWMLASPSQEGENDYGPEPAPA